MATVYVNSWSEFVSAIGVSGNTVVLPENAEWDMGEILPYGLSSNINIACKSINGRGTRIKNLNLNSYYFNYDGTDVKYFQNLLMTDWIGTNKFFNLRFGSQFTRCAISGITSNSVVIDNSSNNYYPQLEDQNMPLHLKDQILHLHTQFCMKWHILKQ